MTCQTLNAPPAGVTAYLVAGSTTTMLAEGLPENAQLEFAASADGPVLLSLEGVVRDEATAFELTARQVDDLIARTARYVRIVTGDGDSLHVLAAGRVWERSGWSGECGRTQVVTRLIAGPPGPKGDKGADSTVPGPKGDKGDDSTVPGPKGDTGADGRGVESITDDDEDGIATVLYTDGAVGALPLPRGPQGDPAPLPEIAWAGDVLTVDGVSSPPLSGPAGPAPATSWLGTSLIVGDNPPVDLRGPQGGRGPIGSPGAVATASDYLLVGPGRPDTPATTGGTITGGEPVGCEYRSTDGAGVGAWVWMKRPTGWEVTDGNTGLRRLEDKSNGSLGSLWPRDGLYMIRVNQSVLLRADWGTGFPGQSESTPRAPTIYALDAGFRSNGNPTGFLDSDGENVGGALIWNQAFKVKGTKGAWRKAFIQWLTVDPWPTTLPGSPA